MGFVLKNKITLFVLSVLLLSTFLSFWGLDKIDLEASEDIYVADSVGYLRGDPFMAPRHHLRKPHAPASPHPFFVQFLTFLTFKYFGLSLFSTRIVQAASIVIGTFVVMLLGKAIFSSWNIGIFSGFVFTTFPLVIRFGRMAVLDSVLATVQGLGMLWMWFCLKARGMKGYIFAAFAGIALGLSISTKLTGIFFVFPLLALFIWQYIRTHDRYFLVSLSLFLFSSITIFFLLNDPYSYYWGWTHFSDPKHQNISLTAILKGFIAFKYWYLFVVSLLGIMPFFTILYALRRHWRFWKNEKRVFFTLWIIAPLSYLILNPIHVTGLSAEWSYLPLFLPLSLILAKTFFDLWQRHASRTLREKIGVLYGFYFVSIAMPLVWYGLRFRPLPLASYQNARNVVFGDLAVTKIVDELNTEKKKVLVLVVTKGINFPLWMLHSNIATEPFYKPIQDYDYIVTDNVELMNQAQENSFILQRREKNPSEPELSLFSRK